MSWEDKKKWTPREPLPTPDPLVTGHPPDIKTTRRHEGVLFVAGAGKAQSDVMFVQTSLQEEEAMDKEQTRYGAAISDKPRYLKSPAGVILKDTMMQRGLDLDEMYFTALCKWLLPKAERKKPKREHIELATQAFYNEIERVKPKIIVCMGKPSFDVLVNIKASASDLEGGWFQCDKFNCKVYLMPDIMMPVFKPEYIERFSVDFDQIKRMVDATRGVEVYTLPRNFYTIETFEQLCSAVDWWKTKDYGLFSVDCEWGGNNHIDGTLRSFQLAPTQTEALYVKFMNERREYTMNRPYKECGDVMATHLNKKDVKYIGHHIAADYPWMHTWLGLEYYQKTFFDTEFGMQVVDENAPLGLEEIALRYTDFGRYDLELQLWKKANKQEEDAGYAFIPDAILIPYGCLDVLAPMRAYPWMLSRMMAENTATYFFNIFLPFVSDIFTHFSLVGLPMNIPKMDELRKLFTYARDQLNIKLQQRIHREAEQLLLKFMHSVAGDTGMLAGLNCLRMMRDPVQRDAAFEVFKQAIGPDHTAKGVAFFEHLRDAPTFNIRSAPHMRRWMFDVVGHTPIKSTSNKSAGLPSTSWEKVLAMPPSRQKEMTPSTDKQTLQILSEKDGTIMELLNLNAVGNLCKAFLKEPTLDEEGNLTRENGLHFWVAKDGRIHGQMSTTDTGRPRSWKPNTLNWPSYVNKKIAEGVGNLLAEQFKEGVLPPEFHGYVHKATIAMEENNKTPGKDPETISSMLGKVLPSIRSCVDASVLPPLPGSVGWCLVESDYKTAEIRGKAFMSGDVNLIRLMTEKDPQFGLVKEGADILPVRISYAGDCGIPKECWDQKPIMTIMKEGKIIRAVSPEELLRNPDGTLQHPDYDLHWSLAEWVKQAAREFLSKKKDRDGTGKVGNFSTTYGAVAATLERKIESETGKKPEPGTGDKILQALAEREPVATRWLEEDLANAPEFPGYIIAESGRKRHFVGYGSISGAISAWERKKQLAALGRIARNFPMQESVASTAARAGIWLLDEYRKRGMHACLMTILYDSCVTLCPIEERFIVMEMHEQYMTTVNEWHNHGRTWNYPSEHELNYAWSSRPDKGQRKKLEDRNWANDPVWMKEEFKKAA